MICAAIGFDGLDGKTAREIATLLGPVPGRSLTVHGEPGLALGQFGGKPGRSTSGRHVLFNGQLHNAATLAAEFGMPAAPPADLYAAAVDRWGDRADDHVVGHYCTIATIPGSDALRCARSPIEAPPLHFRLRMGGAIAASLPRPLFWRDPEMRQINLDRLARTLLADFSDRYAGPYLGCHRMPQGTAIVLHKQGWDEIWGYDLMRRPAVQLPQIGDYVEAARTLLDEAVAATLDGATRPGILLSGGLDSPSVAASALRQIGERGKVFGFTYGPQSDWSPVAPAPGKYVSELPGVRAFAEMYPAMQLETFTNDGRDFRFRQRELVQAMDCGTPSVGLCWPHHAIHERAAALGCDVLLSPNWGNETFSSNAPWAIPEWFIRGRWQRMLQALRHDDSDQRPLWRRVLALGAMPWLPDRGWRSVQRAWHGAWPDPLAASAINPGWAEGRGLFAAIRRSGREPGRFQTATRQDFWRAVMAEDGQDREQYSQGMEVLHGVPLRDPAAYRPLVEFCFGLPTDLFRRDGQTRWLAREMGRGRLPEAIRTRAETGTHHPDWHARIAPICGELAAGLALIGDDPDAAAILDLPRLEKLVAQLPGLKPGDHHARLPYVTALPIGFAAAQFIAYAKGRNDF